MPKEPRPRKTRSAAGCHKPILSLQKGLWVLNAFSQDRPEWGVRELGRELGINPTTTFRLIKTLQDAGYVERNPVTQRYLLGPKVVEIADLYTRLNPMPSVALAVFAGFNDRFQYNFYLGALRGRELVYLARAEGHGPIQVSAEPGEHLALHTTALGKVLLAFQEDTFIAEYLKIPRLKAFTPRTIVNRERLRAQIGQIRDQGWALNDGERYEDIGSVGVPVYDGQGRAVASVSLAYPRYLVQEGRLTIPEMVSMAREIAAEIASRCGGARSTSPIQ